MQDHFRDVVGQDEGARSVRTGSYGGFAATVVTGYNALSDNWPFHVYVQKAGEQKARLTDVPTPMAHPSQRGAIDQGFAIAKSHIDRHNNGTGLQQTVATEMRQY